jgi:hypothetical protein
MKAYATPARLLHHVQVRSTVEISNTHQKSVSENTQYLPKSGFLEAANIAGGRTMILDEWILI